MIDYAAAAEFLQTHDKRLARWMAKIGEPRPYAGGRETIFMALLESIVFQQLNGKAASTILGRVKTLFPKKRITPAALLAMDETSLRNAGLSRNKLLALRDLAAKALDGTLPTARQAARLSDEELIARCSQVRGVGRWTVEMLLIFRLGRPDVLPLDDFGVRKGFQKAFGLKELPSKETMEKRGRHWAPHRSMASWYLWRIAEL